MNAQSARGLFRATGKVAKGELAREKDDFYPTPPEPTRALLRAEDRRLHDFPVIWEPAAGDGAMVREIEAAGYACIGTDLIQRGGSEFLLDFMETGEAIAPAIVTNPPYNLVNCRDGKGRWITHAMDTLGVEYMALLLNWSWPGAGGLAPLWDEWRPSRVYLCRWKIDFTGEGAPPMLNGWFIWDRAACNEHPPLLMLDRADDARQGDLI